MFTWNVVGGIEFETKTCYKYPETENKVFKRRNTPLRCFIVKIASKLTLF